MCYFGWPLPAALVIEPHFALLLLLGSPPAYSSCPYISHPLIAPWQDRLGGKQS